MQLNIPAVFNGFFGIKTDFKDVTSLDDNGNPINSGSSATGSNQPTNGTALTATGSSNPDFGKCTEPEIKFAVALDNRKETAFAPVDQGSRPIPVQ